MLVEDKWEEERNKFTFLYIHMKYFPKMISVYVRFSFWLWQALAAVM